MLKQLWVLWRQPTVTYAFMLKGAGLALLICTLILGVAFLGTDSLQEAMVARGGAMGIAAAVICAYLCACSLNYYHDKIMLICSPENLKLVPGLRFGVALSQILLSIVLSVIFSGIMSIWFNHFWLTWLLAMFFLPSTYLMRQSKKLFVLFFALPFIFPLSSIYKLVADSNPFLIISLIGVVIAIWCLSLYLLLRKPSEARQKNHQLQLAAYKNRQQLMQGKGSNYNLVWYWLGNLTSWRYTLTQGKSPQQILVYGLGPLFSSWVIRLLGVAIIFAIYFTWPFFLPSAVPLAENKPPSISYMSLFLLVVTIQPWIRSLRKTAREQSLLRLLPHAPIGKSLNHWLAKKIWLDIARLWGLAVGCQLLYVMVHGLPIAPLLWPLVFNTAAVLLLMGYTLMRFRNIQRRNTTIEILEAVVALFYAWLAINIGTEAFSLLLAEAAVVMLVGTAWAVWRWKQFVNGPAALPVGRLLS